MSEVILSPSRFNQESWAWSYSPDLDSYCTQLMGKCINMGIRAKEDSKPMLGRVPSPLSGYSALKDKEHGSPLLECGLCIVTSLPRVGVWKEGVGKSDFRGEKVGK